MLYLQATQSQGEYSAVLAMLPKLTSLVYSVMRTTPPANVSIRKA